MSHAQQLRELLEPLGVYAWEGSSQWAELTSVGHALDLCADELELIQQEMNLETAHDFGLTRICSLLSRSPVAEAPRTLGQALAALLRIGDRSFTVSAIGDNLKGCGIPAAVKETATPGLVEVSFPGVPGIPEDFEEIRPIMEGIIPCHVEVSYVFWYLTWRELALRGLTWRTIAQRALTWKELECFVRG